MGWWWSSSSRADEQLNTPSLSSTPSLSQNSPPPSNPPTTLNEHQQHDAELREFLAAIEWTGNTTSSSTSSSSPKTNSPPSQTNPTTPSNPPPSTPENTTPSSISFESLYPDTMSCRSAFDYAFFCQSFGGQWVNVYRYGELRSCSEHWENFWLCMKARGYSDESRRKTIRDHYRKKAVKYKTGPSSEDVWEVRTEPVKNPFGGNMADYDDKQKREDKIGGEPLGQV